MSFNAQLVASIAACSRPQLSHLQHDLWRAWSAGTINDEEAQAAAEAIHARSTVAPIPAARPEQRRSAYPRRRPQRSADRQASLERKRTLAASWPLPPALAASFTTGELAALRIVADEVKRQGNCAAYVDAIAARAGVSRSTVQRALRQARALGLVVVQERRRAGQPSLTNIIRVIDKGWLTWLRLGGRGDGGRGCQKWHTTDNRYTKRVNNGNRPSPTASWRDVQQRRE